jgi:hypothetical protein
MLSEGQTLPAPLAASQRRQSAISVNGERRIMQVKRVQFLPHRPLCPIHRLPPPREIGLTAEPQTAFFSYSRDDSEFALRLAEDLKAARANVWLDQLDIAPGQRWARAVQDALNNCHRLLVILSPSSVGSSNVEDEVAFALEEHKTVIPVFYRDCKVPFQLRPFQYVDFRADYDRGLKTLLRTLGVEQQTVAAGAAEEVYLDPETRLMWTIRDNGKDIDWRDANQYAGQLRLAGHSDWRLPTIDELEKLYDPENSSAYKIRKPFRLTSYWVWSSTKEGSGSAWHFHFSYGKRSANPMGGSNGPRALCVRRSGK